jgi:hypothetical protein
MKTGFLLESMARAMAFFSTLVRQLEGEVPGFQGRERTG